MQRTIVEYFVECLDYAKMSPELRNYILKERAGEISVESVMNGTGASENVANKALSIFRGDLNKPQKRIYLALIDSSQSKKVTPVSIAHAGKMGYNQTFNYIDWKFAEYMNQIKLGRDGTLQHVRMDTPITSYPEIIREYYPKIDDWREEAHIKAMPEKHKKARAAPNQRTEEVLKILGIGSTDEITIEMIDGLTRADWRDRGFEMPPRYAMHGIKENLKRKLKNNAFADY